MKEAIAEEWVIFEGRDGTRRPGVIRIEQPCVDEEGEPRCGVVIEGLYEKMPAIAGASKLRALLLAVDFCASLLRDFVAHGGRIIRAESEEAAENDEVADEDFDIDACFGPVQSAHAAPSSGRRDAGALRRRA